MSRIMPEHGLAPASITADRIDVNPVKFQSSILPEDQPGASLYGRGQHHESLPNVELTGKEFGELANEVFSHVDANGDGRLTEDELARALKYRLTTDTDKTIAAIQGMYDNYAFLKGMSPQGFHPEHPDGITRQGIDLAAGIAAGTIDPHDYTLERGYRRGWSEVLGSTVGLFTGLGGLAAGASVLEAGTNLGMAAACAGGLVGLAAGVGAVVGIGYGIGYGLDRLHAWRYQDKEVNTFVKSLRGERSSP